MADAAGWIDAAARVFAMRIGALLAGEGRDPAMPLGPFVPATHAVALAAAAAQGAPAPDPLPQALSDPRRLAPLPVGRLIAAYDLPATLAPLFALMLVAERDARFSTLFAWLHDDHQRRRLTPALAARILGTPPPVAWSALLAPNAPLRAGAMIAIEAGDDRPLPDRALRWTDAMAAFLLGEADAIDPALAGHVEHPPVLPRALLLDDPVDATRLVLTGTPGSGRAAAAAALLRARGAEPLVVRLPDGPEAPDLLRIAMRAAALGPGALVVIDAESVPADRLRAMPVPPHLAIAYVATCRLALDLQTIALPALNGARTRAVWRHLLGPHRHDDADLLAHRFRLPLADIVAVAGGAELPALSRACLDRSSTALAELATPIDVRHDWDDLVLTERQLDGLRAIVSRGAHARTVYDDWDMAAKLAPGRGLTALFSGPSGAGKTLSAGVVARALGLPLYRVDLSATVSKYIGETEKNLDRVFAAAEAGNACLFFDECDALFGKRSEVSDAHDRYANIETSYLLQRLEGHRGIVMLASNFPQNIDDAFSRRIDITIDFALPGAAMRARLWARLMPAAAGAAIDCAALGAGFELSGGAIRNCIVTAAFLAADEGTTIRTEHCLRAVAQEYAKTGRTLTRKQFGDSFGTLRTRADR